MIYTTPSTLLVEVLGWAIFLGATLFTLAWQARAIFDPRNARPVHPPLDSMPMMA